jgi:class 3 adenylate cyclase
VRLHRGRGRGQHDRAARVASEAGAGEILVSDAAARAAALETAGLGSRELALRGRDEAVQAWVL